MNIYLVFIKPISFSFVFLKNFFLPPFHLGEIVNQCYRIGVKSFEFWFRKTRQKPRSPSA